MNKCIHVQVREPAKQTIESAPTDTRVHIRGNCEEKEGEGGGDGEGEWDSESEGGVGDEEAWACDEE